MPLSEFPPPGMLRRRPPDIRVLLRGRCRGAPLERLAQVECPRLRQRGANAAPAPAASTAAHRARLRQGVERHRRRRQPLRRPHRRLRRAAARPLRRRPSCAPLEGQAERLMQALGDVYSADAKLALLERLASLHPGLRAARHPRPERQRRRHRRRSRPRGLATGQARRRRLRGRLPRPRLRPAARVRRAPLLPASPSPPSSTPTSASRPTPARPAISTASPRRRRARRSPTATSAPCSSSRSSGRGGCVVPPSGFLARLLEAGPPAVARSLIADEVWTGLGRSGSMVRAPQPAPRRHPLLRQGPRRRLSPSRPASPPRTIMLAWAARPRGAAHLHACGPAARLCRRPRHARCAPLPQARPLVPRSSATAPLRPSAPRSTACPASSRCAASASCSASSSTAASARFRAMREMLARGYLVLTGGCRSEVITLTPALNVPEERLLDATGALREVLTTS